MNLLDKITRKCKINIDNVLLSLTNDTTRYWNERAKKHGLRSVINIGHSIEDDEKVTNNQKKLLFPILQKSFTGNEKVILDFGCGPGRFTHGLADLINGKCIGVDTTQYLLEIAPLSHNVEYRIITKNGIIPAETNSIDAVWICLVMGGIINHKLIDKTINELDRVLKQDASIILIENTTNEKSTSYWKFRTVDFYLKLFGNYSLNHETDYYDLGQRISVFTGKKA